MKRIIYFAAEYYKQEIIYQKEELFGAYIMAYEEAMAVFQFDSSIINFTIYKIFTVYITMALQAETY